MYHLPIVPEPPREFEVHGVKYRRTGSCNRCGECCRGDAFLGGLGPPEVPGMCPYFRWLAPGVGHCVGHDSSYYKNGCIDWPSKPSHKINNPSCSYEFTAIEE